MRRSGEQGSASVKFLIVMAIMGSIAYAAYLYLPVAINAVTYKDLMQHLTEVAATQGHPPSWLGDQLAKSAPEYGIPADAVITPAIHDGRIEVRVEFVKVIEFPGYPYNYEFDYTAKSTAFLTFK
jgi:hypothetical protein